MEESRKLGLEVIDRCNLTVLLEPDQEGLVDFLAANKVSLSIETHCAAKTCCRIILKSLS